MNILYIRTHYWLNLKTGGSVSHTAGVVNGFIQNQDKVQVVTNDELPGVSQKICRFIKPFLIPKIPRQISEFIYNKFIVPYKVKKTDAINYDYLYQRYSGFAVAGVNISRKYNIPLIVEFNSSDVWKLKNWQNKKKQSLRDWLQFFYYTFCLIPFATYFEQQAIKNAAYIVVVSEALKDTLLKKGISKDKVIVVPNGVDDASFYPRKKNLDLMKRYHLSREKVILGFIGTFGPWH